MKRGQVTPEMLKMMDPETAAKYGYLDKIMPKGIYGEPAVPKLERDEHSDFENWLNLHGFAYRHSRTDKPTREMCGAPDFTVYAKKEARDANLNVCLAIEFKLPGNKLSKVQEEWAAKYGGKVHILATAQEAIELVKHWFGE